MRWLLSLKLHSEEDGSCCKAETVFLNMQLEEKSIHKHTRQFLRGGFKPTPWQFTEKQLEFKTLDGEPDPVYIATGGVLFIPAFIL